MKKLFVLSLLFFNLPAFGLVMANISNGCDSVGERLYAVFELTEYNCASGTWLPANSETCITCPANATCTGGTFYLNETENQGIVVNYPITQNMTAGCDIATPEMIAVYQRNEYNCANGTWLPTNSETCINCPANATCSGGTFYLNETENQGIVVNYPVTQNMTAGCDFGKENMVAVFHVNQYTCSAGQYLPADAIACTACPTGYTCGGGTYNFNENTDQGLTANNISLTWQDDNGNAINSGTCSYGEAISLPTTPTKTGYTFAGWQVVSN